MNKVILITGASSGMGKDVQDTLRLGSYVFDFDRYAFASIGRDVR